MDPLRTGGRDCARGESRSGGRLWKGSLPRTGLLWSIGTDKGGAGRGEGAEKPQREREREMGRERKESWK